MVPGATERWSVVAGDPLLAVGFDGAEPVLGASQWREARARLAPVCVVSVSAREAVLRRRLESRGRERAEEIDARLARARAIAVLGDDVVEIHNDGALDEGIATFVALLARPNLAVLAFRGTESDKFKDVKTGLHGGLHDTEQGGIRRGFHRAYKSVVGEIKAGLAEVDGLSLYITGHSLGAALAVIAARDLDDDDLAACYTFGCPRIGDTEFDMSVKAPVYRVVNAADGVTRVPSMWFGYRHVGDLRYLTRDGQMIRNPNTWRITGRTALNLLTSAKVTLRKGDEAVITEHDADTDTYFVYPFDLEN